MHVGIAGSRASPSLVAHIAVQKYANGMPLYRLEKGFVFDGVNISRETMANWVVKCAEMYLNALYALLISFLLRATSLHADETTAQVLHEPGREAQSKSYEWVYRTSGSEEHPIVIYEYQEIRKQEYPQRFLAGYKSLLHMDGCQVYHNLPPEIVIIGCWGHERRKVRRKWENVWKTLPKDKREGSDAERGLMYLNALFELAREWKTLSPEERYQKRIKERKSTADAYFAWVENLGTLPKLPLGEAAHYTLSQRKYLEHVFTACIYSIYLQMDVQSFRIIVASVR